MYNADINHSANEVPLDGRNNNGMFSKGHYPMEDDSDGYKHQIPQQSFEGKWILIINRSTWSK